MRTRRFRQVDVFTGAALRGNPLAVVADADGLTAERMQEFARWTALSETTFLLPPEDPAADYRVRIFTPGGELPFAGHPTLGTAHVWLALGGRPQGERVVQECAAGLVEVRRDATGLQFAAPSLQPEPPVDAALRERIQTALGVREEEVLGIRRLTLGPAWIGVRLPDADRVLSLNPDWAALAGLEVGVVGLRSGRAECAIEVRAFCPGLGVAEDPVTGSLQAALGQWLIGDGTLPDRYVASQGSCVGRQGRVTVSHEPEGLWIGGAVTDVIAGEVTI